MIAFHYFCGSRVSIISSRVLVVSSGSTVELTLLDAGMGGRNVSIADVGSHTLIVINR